MSERKKNSTAVRLGRKGRKAGTGRAKARSREQSQASGVGESEGSSSMVLPKREENSVVAGSGCQFGSETEKAAQAPIDSLRERDIKGHEITEFLGNENPSASPVPSPESISISFSTPNKTVA